MVVFASMIKDGYEDYKKYKNDALENNQKTTKLNRSNDSFEVVAWKDIEVGDVIEIKSD